MSAPDEPAVERDGDSPETSANPAIDTFDARCGMALGLFLGGVTVALLLPGSFLPAAVENCDRCYAAVSAVCGIILFAGSRRSLRRSPEADALAR